VFRFFPQIYGKKLDFRMKRATIQKICVVALSFQPCKIAVSIWKDTGFAGETFL
jgi:hypothetical protein